MLLLMNGIGHLVRCWGVGRSRRRDENVRISTVWCVGDGVDRYRGRVRVLVLLVSLSYRVAICLHSFTPWWYNSLYTMSYITYLA